MVDPLRWTPCTAQRRWPRVGLGRVFLPEESKKLMGLDNLDAAVATQS